MPNWNAKQYLKFAEERTRPCDDLARSVQIEYPELIIDLGCGPGNSTQALVERWPEATIMGLDSSEQMLDVARKTYPQGKWMQADIANWSASTPYDLIFSNAALQWLPDHEKIFPHLLRQVKPGGAFAFQMPATMHSPAHQLMHDLAASSHWQNYFSRTSRGWHVHAPAFYYDILAPETSHINLWQTEYFHVLSGPEAIIEWYKGTALPSYLDALSQDQQAHFLDDYLHLVEKAYSRQPNGQVLFPFLRLFVVAYRT